ncbi:hypothetical protein DDB_G0285087 [Dictyostelium discoideum AX4]|uniref:SAP domain-containing protein n=1 Tax=Dictyostelium discoideum TaxID=44689 RepID=Q54NR4_DICDI|nr:hypothetical protein DDB_G0285087 [Dictyostelium discoideum AX4]EAL65007.1 hypothetical protein DDB_G0285087 [Dictyostelium discoideum AX4]|eukprot:XP_640003.1 hypothetical protein DDB_G0285087 [Dictyostelium discoideum AX4]
MVEINNEKDNNNNSEDTDIDTIIEELENKTYLEIKKVAKSKFGVNAGGKKSEILKRIKNSINSKSNQLKTISSTITTTTKTTLNNKPMDNNEKLFWKVFKNKFLITKIMNHTNSGPHRLTYDDVHNAIHLIECNEIELLKEKVNRNQYLTGYNRFGNFSFFQSIKNDKQFYTNLINNYLNISTIIIDIEFILKIIIQNDCIGALKSLFEEFNIIKELVKIELIDLIKLSIESCSYKSFKYLIINKTITTNILPNEQFWKLILNSKNNSSSSFLFKFINYINFNDNDNLKLFYKCKFEKKELKRVFEKCPIDELKLRIKDLKNSCISIIYLNLNESNNIIFKNVNEINELYKSLFLLKSDRNQILLDFIYDQYSNNNKDNEKFNFILKLLKMYFENCNSNHDEFYSMLLNNNRHYSYKSNEPRRNQLFKNSIKFGNFQLFKVMFKLINCLFDFYEPVSNDGFKPMLFQFENNLKNKIEFIKQVCQLVKNNSNYLNFIFNQVLLYDDLELIELAYNQLDKPMLKIEFINQDNYRASTNSNKKECEAEFYFIRSEGVLEFIFKNCLKNCNKILPITNFIYNGRLDLVEKYKSLLSSSSPSSSSQEISNIEPSFKLDPPICYSHRLYSITIAMKAMIGFINSPSLSNGCGDSDGDGVIFKNEHFFGLNNLKSISDFIYLINHKFTNQKGPFYFSFYGHPPLKFYIKILIARWIYYNKPNHFERFGFNILDLLIKKNKI